MRFLDGVYLMSAPTGLSPQSTKDLAKEVQELGIKYNLEILLTKAPPLLVRGDTFFCHHCKEKIVVEETHSSLTNVPECPFCGNTDRVYSLSE